MLHHAQNIPAGTTLQGDLCIVGAGAAGISLAMAFIAGPTKVILLESGSMAFDVPTQELYRGTYDGPFVSDGYLMSSRLRYFGGTTNHWTGSVRPLDPIDFERRDWVPHSGWPMKRAQLWPYYQEAAHLVKIPPFEHDTDDGTLLAANPFEQNDSGPLLMPKLVAKSKPVRFGPKYGKILINASNIDVVLNANVLRIHTGSRPG